MEGNKFLTTYVSRFTFGLPCNQSEFHLSERMDQVPSLGDRVPISQIDAYRPAILIRTIVHYLWPLIFRQTISHLIEIAGPRQIQYHVICNLCKPRPHVLERVRHLIKIEHFLILVAGP